MLLKRCIGLIACSLLLSQVILQLTEGQLLLPPGFAAGTALTILALCHTPPQGFKLCNGSV